MLRSVTCREVLVVMRIQESQTLFLLALGLTSASCASRPAINLTPADLTPQDGVLVGRVNATNRDEDETKHCYVEFVDPNKERVAYLSLDESGWVFATVPPGRVTLSYVGCVIYAAVTQSVAHQAQMDIDVPPGNQAAYFGEVSVAFQSQKKNLFVEALTPALAKAMIPEKRNPPSVHSVTYNQPRAVSELQTRYGSAINQLKLVQVSRAAAVAPGSAPPKVE
jgi:hypothetical protein